MRSYRALAATVALSALGLISPAVAASAPTKQRIAITARAGINGFVLQPMGAGKLAPDSGTAEWCCWSRRLLTRDGQRVEVNNPVATLTGKRGTLVLRWRIEWLDAGNGYTIGASTWKVVRGTGVYDGISGSGRGAASWLPRGPVTFRAEGFLRSG
jgi:hypothetical protein